MDIPISEVVCKTANNNIMGCTPFGKKIADALIRVSSTRIFSNPEDSILELIANSSDSYARLSGEPSIGKFGMGFFSMFYWLYNDPSLVMEIDSSYVGDGKLQTYGISISYSQENGLNYSPKPYNTIYDLNRENTLSTGTRITVKRSLPKLSKDGKPILGPSPPFSTFPKITEQMYRYNNIKINLEREINNTKIPTKSLIDGGSPNTIRIVCGDVFTIEDNAEGIPMQILTDSLLVPSSSTKIRSFIPPLLSEINPPSVTSWGRFSSLTFVVNNINIFTIKLNVPGNSYYVPMPNSTRLPVARDDIIFQENSMEAFFLSSQLNVLLDKIIQQEKAVTNILSLLDKYSSKSSQIVLSLIINNLKQRINNMDNVIYFDVKDIDIYRNLYGLFPGYIFCFHPNPQMYVSENKIDALLSPYSKDDMFLFRKVIAVPSLKNTIKTAGLSKYLFISEEIFKSPTVVEDIIARSSNNLLIPIGEKIGDHIVTKCKEFLTIPYPDDVFREFCLMMMVWIRITCSVKLTFQEKYYFSVMTDYLKSLSFDFHIKFFRAFASRISEIKFNFSYASSPIVNGFMVNNVYPPKFNVKLPNNYKNINDRPEHIVNKINHYKEKLLMWGIQTIGKETLGNVYYFPDLIHFRLDMYLESRPFSGLSNRQMSSLLDTFDRTLSECELMALIFIVYYLPFVNERTSNIFDIILTEIRRRADSEEIEEIMMGLFLNLSNRDSFEFKIRVPVTDIAMLHLIEKEDKLQLIPFTNEQFNYSFTAKSLTQFLYIKDVDPQMKNIQEIFTQATEFTRGWDSKDFKLQTVEIAVNDGTTKDFTEAVMTELFQNSLDAIRSSERIIFPSEEVGIPGGPISSGGIDIVVSSDGISFTDPIGIEKSHLPSLLIPFLSLKDTKDPNVTGEMGTGFFNLYRAPWSEKVVISTSFDDNFFEITATPIRISETIVVDIDYKIKHSIEKNLRNGTTVSVYLRNSDKRLSLVSNAFIFASNYFGFGDETVTLNGGTITSEKQLIMESKFPDGRPLGQSYFCPNRMKSFVMTNGVPFLPLTTLCESLPDVIPNFLKLCSMGTIINIDKSCYQATQNRTKIVLSEDQKKRLTQFINNSLYLSLLYEYSSPYATQINHLVNHTMSTTFFGNCSLSTSPLIDENGYNYDFLAYKYSSMLEQYVITSDNEAFSLKSKFFDLSEWKGKSLATIVEYAKEMFIKNNIKEYNHNLFGTDIVSRALSLWFYWKSFKSEESVENIGKDKILRIKPSETLQKFINYYWYFLSTLNLKVNGSEIFKTTPTPQIFFGELSKTYDGIYYNESNRIILNDEVFSEKEFEDKLQELEKLTMTQKILEITTQKFFINYFSSELPIPTIIHELLHTILRNSHGSDGHQDVLVTLEGKAELLSFDIAAQTIYRAILEKGILTKFLESLNWKRHQQ